MGIINDMNTNSLENPSSDKMLMTSVDILNNLKLLNDSFVRKGITGELCLVGGAVMCLAYKSRLSTHDIDGIFEPKSKIYESVIEVAKDNDLESDWLNDSVKGFLSKDAEFVPYHSFSNLNILVATPQYLLAMKVLSSRIESTNDRQDILFLINFLKLRTLDEVLSIVLKFYPSNLFTIKSKYLVMEVLDEIYGE